MKLKKAISILVALTFICNFTMVAFAEVKDISVTAPTYGDEAILNEMRARNLTDFEKNVDLKIPNRIFLSEEEAGRLPGVTTGFYYESINDLFSPQSVGDGYVIGRARSWKTASGGYIRKGYKKGTFSSIASVALSFVGGIPAMTVSTILGVVGLMASGLDMVSGETLITYRYLYRDGEGRWSSDPNTSKYWFLGYRTGRRETYKHVIGGKLNESTQKWTLEMKNYTSSPAETVSSNNYSKSDSWLAEQGRQWVTTSRVYDECPW